MRFSVLITAIFVFFTSYSQESITVFVNRTSGEDEKAAVKEMCSLIQKSLPVNFVIDSVNKFSGKGIYITAADKDLYKKAPAGLKKLGPEGIFIRSTHQSLYISGNSSFAAQEGIFIYLDRLGFRFYFPNPAWHIFPSLKSIFRPFTSLSEPAFKHRGLSMGWGYPNNQQKEEFLFWERANLMPGQMQLNMGHAYYNLLLEKRGDFEKNPGYLTIPLKDGKRQSNSLLNYGADGLDEVAYEWLATNIENAKKRNIRLDMLSMEPFDGNNFCNLPECLKIGTTASDQIFYFTNKVAQKLKKTYPDKKIGMLAYYDHIDIPKYPIEDNIFITLTNGYNTTNFSIDQLISRWKTKTNVLGIYDYLALYAGSSADLPGKDPGGSYKKIAQSIKKFNNSGIIAYQAETTYGWMSKGLSHYLIAKLGWNANANTEAIIDEFFRLCFPQSNKLIRSIFDSWNTNYIITDDEVYFWFSTLQNAFSVCNEKSELQRLHHLALYLYYVKLQQEYINSANDIKPQKRIELCAYLWSVLPLGVVPSFAALNMLPLEINGGNTITNENANWKKLKISYPQNKQEWVSFINSYLPSLKRVVNVRRFDNAPFLSAQQSKSIDRSFSWINPKRTMSFSGTLYAIADTRSIATDSLFIRMSGGVYRKTGRIGIKIFPFTESFDNAKLIKQYDFPADGNAYTIKLDKLPRNKYIFSFTDDGTLGNVYFPENMKFSFISSEKQPVLGGSFNAFYFYVPEGTSVFYITKTHYLQVYTPSNKLIESPLEEKRMEIHVSKGEAGWWRTYMQREEFHLIGIPAIISRDPASFLFP